MSSSFTLTAVQGTDVWKKYPSWDTYNVPSRRASVEPLASFRRASISFDPHLVEQYDQGGMILTMRAQDAANKTPTKWIKTGLELYNGTLYLSTVTCDRYADWSVTPLAAVGSTSDPMTLIAERDENEHGISVWVYYVPPDGRAKVPLREIGWFYAEEGGKWDLEVAAYAARPVETAKQSLTVEFSDFDVTWA